MDQPMTFDQLWQFITVALVLGGAVAGVVVHVYRLVGTLRKEIHDHKLHIAEMYLTRLTFERFEKRIFERFDKSDNRLDSLMETLVTPKK